MRAVVIESLALAPVPTAARPRRVEFFVAGTPATKGSARPFAHHDPATGRTKTWTRDMSGPKGKTWAALVAGGAMEAWKEAPADGPVVVRVEFFFARPKAHFTKKGLRPGAPAFKTSPGDLDKCLRAALDALTSVVFTDDARIVELSGCKRYSNDGRTGARFTVEEREAA